MLGDARQNVAHVGFWVDSLRLCRSGIRMLSPRHSHRCRPIQRVGSFVWQKPPHATIVPLHNCRCRGGHRRSSALTLPIVTVRNKRPRQYRIFSRAGPRSLPAIASTIPAGCPQGEIVDTPEQALPVPKNRWRTKTERRAIVEETLLPEFRSRESHDDTT